MPAPQLSRNVSYTQTAKLQSKGSVIPTNNPGKESSSPQSTRSNCLSTQGTCAPRSNGYQAIKTSQATKQPTRLQNELQNQREKTQPSRNLHTNPSNLRDRFLSSEQSPTIGTRHGSLRRMTQNNYGASLTSQT